MDTSIIDLCDSDDENKQTAFKADNKYSNDAANSDDDSSSSSSDDSHLWSAGGFLKGSPQRGKEEVKRGNYFKEVRSKYGDDTDADGRNAKRQKCNTTGSVLNSPIISLDINDEEFEGGDSSKLEYHRGPTKDSATANNHNASLLQKKQSNIGRMEKKRLFSPNKSSNKRESSSLSPSKKTCKNRNKKDEQEVECIEIDLSDSSSNDSIDDKKIGISEERGGKFKSAAGKNASDRYSKPSSNSLSSRNNKNNHSEVDDSDFDIEFRIQQKRPVAKKKKVQNPYKKSYNSDDNSSQHSSNSTVSPEEKKRPAAKKTVQNPYKKQIATKQKSSHSDDNSSHSSNSTVSLPEEKKRPMAKKSVQNLYTTKKKLYHSDDSSSHSSNSTVSMSEGKQSPAMKNHPRKLESSREVGGTVGLKNGKDKGRVSFNNSIDVEFNNDEDGSTDFNCDMYGGFDEDDDEFPSKANNVSRYKKDSGNEAFATLKAKPKTQSNQKMSLKEDIEVFAIDSDDSDNDSNSNSSAELFTPRPFKKKGKKPAAYKSDQSATKSIEKKCPNSSSSKLLTPCTFSPATTSPTMGAYSKRQVPTPAIPAMAASLVKEIGGKLYPDLRHNFMVALTNHARRLRHNSYQRGPFDSALRSIVVISLHMRPIRSAEAAGRLKGVGSNFHDLLKESSTGPKGKKPFSPAIGKFSCVAAATLVALLGLEEDNASAASANGLSFPMEDLLRKVNELLDSRANAALNQSAEKYLDPDNLDPGFGQIKKLASTNAAADLGGPFIKERKKKDACASGRIYELLDNGREVARALRDFARLGPAEPGPLRQLPDETVDEEFGNVTMSMDFREGGGKNLHKMCDQLDIRRVPYVVRELKIADYLFFVGDKLAPILIERKTADDVASSLHDGRWERQQRAMRKAQYVLGGGPARRCQICYLIEGDPNKKKVHGGNVGRRTYFQSVEDVEAAIEKLPVLGFSVMRSKGHLDTIGVLAKVAQDVSWKANNGSIEANFTYKQFLSRVKVLEEDIGDPPTSHEHQNPAPPVVVNAENLPAPTNNTAVDATTFSPQSDVQSSAQPQTSSAQTSQEEDQLKKMSLAQLKEMCKERNEKVGGKKDDLIARLLKPRKPEILIMRARRNEYVPKVPSSNAALMVALLLNHVPGTQGMAKERLMVLAEETGVSKESMSGDGSFYDGWSGMKQLQEGDPALVRREKGHRYSLTSQPPETSGRAVGHALHILAHREKLCTCSNPPPES